MSPKTVIKKYNKILEFTPENCVGCGICEEVCPKSSVSIYRRGSRFEAEFDDRCAVCGVCADFCFYGALKHEGSVYRELLEEIEFKKVQIDERLCILCGLCMRNCPRGAITVKRKVDLKKLRKGSISVKEGCIDCRLCTDVCPTNAVRIVKQKPVIIEESCIYCEMCSRICPMNVLEVRCDSCRNIAERGYAVSGNVFVDEQRCSMCGICAEICPTKAISVAKLFRGEQIWFEERCLIHCTVCRDICPNSAIQYDYLPRKVVKFNERCNLCGACKRFCPTGAIEIRRELSGELTLDFREIDRKKRKLIRVKAEKCSGCGMCTSFCPMSRKQVLEIVNGIVSEKETIECIACSLCMQNCPAGALEILELSE